MAGTGVIVVVITQSNRGGSDLANLEVNAVTAFTGSIVVEPQDENIHRQIGDPEPNHISVDHNRLGITYGPIIIRCSCGACLADRVPIVIIQGCGGKGHRHGTGLIGRGRIVGLPR